MAKLFDVGGQYPPQNSFERLAKYKRGKAIFDGKQAEMFERATEILKDTPHAEQLAKLYIAVNLPDILLTKPADLMVGEPPQYETGKADRTTEQKRVNGIVEENDLNSLIHELTVSGGYNGDSWLKTRYNYRQDFSELPAGYSRPDSVKMEPIIESVNPAYVFPELSRGSAKRFKAINIAWVEFEDDGKDERAFLNVERHVPGFIMYDRFLLGASEGRVNSEFGADITFYSIDKQVETGRESDVVATGLTHIPLHHIPRKSISETWEGISDIEKMESILIAINDRMVAIDYILMKHADPIMYGPPLDDKEVRVGGGRYIEVTKEEQQPGYMTWSAQLEASFKELDILLGFVFQMSETPQWLFGTTAVADKGGTGTSHTDGAAIKARFMPILSKVKRIRVHVDKAVRDALWTAQLLENFANEEVSGLQIVRAGLSCD